MDTRGKIVPLESAVERTSTGKWLVILASLDPLTAEGAVQLAEIASSHSEHSMCVVVLEDESVLLPAAVRTSLAAALRCVGLVTWACQEMAQATFRTDRDRLIVIDRSEQDTRSSQDFVDLVIAKQQIATQ